MKIRDRIKELRRVPAKDLRPHPSNWRTHPEAQQDALRGVLAEIGYADACLARECEDGSLMLIDGHLRTELTPDAEIPVLVLDVTEEEAKKMLATHDPLAAMAGTNQQLLDTLIDEIGNQDDFLKSLSSQSQDAEITLKPVNVLPPPKMTWVLVGIPTVQFGDIVESIESLAAIDNVILETTSNDG